MAEDRSRKVNRWHIQNPDEAAAFLAKKARNAAKASGGKRILVVGGTSALTDAVCRDLAAHDIGVYRHDLKSLESAISEKLDALEV